MNNATAIASTTSNDTLRLRLVLDINYELNGESSETIKRHLQRACENAIGDGMLSGHTMATVETHTLTVVVVPVGMTEEQLTKFMVQRIENGDLALEDIPNRLARYGLRDPVAFASEMQERIEMAEHDRNEEGQQDA